MLEVNKIYCGDCLELMKELPDKCVGLTMTSPPYNIGNKSLGYHPNSTIKDRYYDLYDDKLPEDVYFNWICDGIKECLRVSKYVFWNMQMLSGNKRTIVKMQYEFIDRLKDIFIWNKQAVSQITKGIMAKGWEYVFMFGDNDSMIFDINNFPPNGYFPNRETWYKKESIPEHHATFPVEMVSTLIHNFTHPNDIILDPFLGSGTTAVAALRTGRRFIGIEISPEYCAIAQKRVDAELAQTRLQFPEYETAK